jgi:hypothetical protein
VQDRYQSSHWNIWTTTVDRIFEHASRMGLESLESIVNKRRDFPYHCGRTRSGINVKNPTTPAMLRVQDGT